jgi:hypothetical protein
MKSGAAYHWGTDPSHDLPPLPPWLLELLTDTAHQSNHQVQIEEGEPISQGVRNSTLTSIAGSMRRRGMSEGAIFAALQIENERRCHPPLSEREVHTIARSVARYAPGESFDYGLRITDRGMKNEGPPLAPHSAFRNLQSGDEIAISPWPMPLAPAAFHGLAGEIARVIEPHSEADPVALLVQTLVAFGNVIGRNAHFVAEDDHHYLNLFAVMVGTTSKGRKGTSWARIRSLCSAVDEVWTLERVQSGLSTGEGLIWAVRDPIERRDPIKEKGVVKDYQTVVTDSGVSDKRLLAMEPEFASCLRVLDREGNTLSALIRQAWDTGTLRVLTKNAPAKATGAHISIIGHITRDELRRYLDTTEAANGFANRFLWLCVRRSKALPEGGGKVHFGDLIARLHTAIRCARQADELKRDAEARALWCEVYEELSDGKPGLLGAVTSRAEAQVMRLACLYALLDCSPEIRRVHLEAALALWRYCEDSVRFVFGDALGDPVADEILQALKEAGEAGLTQTQLNDLFSGNRHSRALARSLASLVEAGRVVCQKEETGNRGRPARRWFAVRWGTEKTEKIAGRGNFENY